LLLTVIGVVWGFTFRGVCVGDNILNALGIKAWSNGDAGTHYTVYYSLIFFAPAFVLGLKHKKDFGATSGMMIAALVGAVLVFSLIFITI